ncbi:MAG: sugar phosphate isomerase/epimerase, partial [Armatimonadetes bacterium]|nr:sugar phosphate isomerase/epimerase [Armatimonadota bacterium]
MKYTRRSALAAMAGAAGTLIVANAADAAENPPKADAPKKSDLKQSVCKWCYGGIPLDTFCAEAKKIGLHSVELLGPNDWPTVKKHGLTCAVANGPGGIVEGWNRMADHDRLVKESERLLPLVAEAGLPNMIVFSGNRRGISDAEGLENCAKGLQRIMPLAEKLNVTVVMELLNSKRDHRDYQADHTAWGVELAKRIGSERFKLLYDIYHMQIMEGDVIRTIERNHPYYGHYH